jgi:hypothetical protein
MRRRSKTNIARVMLAMTLLGAFLCGCQNGRRIVGISNGGTAMVYDTGMDRILYLGRDNGPNLLNVSPDIYQPRPKHRYGYVFRGSAYTWLAPQGGWVDESGKSTDWPPEAAIDEPVMKIVEQSSDTLELLGPVARNGVRERKIWSIDNQGAVHLNVTLLPALIPGKAPDRVSIWSTTTARRGSILAVPEGPMRSDKREAVDAWKKAANTIDGWQVLNIETPLGGKMFIDGPPVIAVWREKHWFVRSGWRKSSPLSPDDAQIEICLDPHMDMFELEMIGPYLPVGASGGNCWRETWRVIPSPTPDVSVLPAWAPREDR